MKSNIIGVCRTFRYLSFLFLFLGAGFNMHAQVIANYGIEGWAAYTPGGKGGKIIRVTNLNASGSGSFAAAVKASGARIVVFDVGGVVDLEGSSISIKNPFVTVAGQTAPGKGITLVNGGVYIHANDVILQHIRIRSGSEGHESGSWEPDALSTVGAYNVVIDHCSFSWAVDENCSVSGSRFNGTTPDDWRMNTSHDVTISNCIIAEALSESTHSKGEHSKGTLIHDNATNIAVLNNLYSCNKDRNPLFKGGARGAVVNNYIYNPGSAAIGFVLNESEWLGHEHQVGYLSLVGNYFRHGPNTNSSVTLLNVGRGPCFVYMEDNITEKQRELLFNEHKGKGYLLTPVKSAWNENISVRSATDVQQYVVENAGVQPWSRDEIDTRIVNEMLAGEGKIIDSEAEVGGFPTHEEVYCAFNENEWNLDYMLKYLPGIDISEPDAWPLLTKDSTYIFEALVDPSADTFNYLELLLDGITVSKVMKPPYKWEIFISEAGNHELLLVADIDSSMKRASLTYHFSVEDPLSSGKQTNKARDFRFSVYPNPFSKQAFVSFVLSQASLVSVDIYTENGMLIDTLINEYRESGEHNVIWNPVTLNTGVYYVKIKIGNDMFFDKIIYR
ncbi:MAG: T9SS type A sorting domain-containing protein [Prolixibacteraceae bacterium]|jgi:hypothetical protein|nr:T9SS type A sorting domain-containing protein [Prolixibacteraceae bacterium]